MSWYRQAHWQVLAALVAGLIYGIVGGLAGWDAFIATWIAPFGRLFLNFLKLIAVPLVFSTLVLGVASLADVRKLSRLGMRTLSAFLALSLLASLIAVSVTLLIRPGAGLPEDMRADLVTAYGASTPATADSAAGLRGGGPLQALVDLVPENLVAAASNNANLLQLVFVALLLGIALLQVPAEKAAPVLGLLDGVATVVIQLVKLGMKLAPIGVFALIADALVTVAPDDPGQLALLLRALGGYFSTLTLALVLQTFVVFPLVLRAFARVDVIGFFRGLSPAMLVAFSTSSSAAALPVTMEQCREELHMSDEVTSFVLPIGATLHMNGTAMFLSVAAVFLAQSFGQPLGAADLFSIVAISLIGSVGAVAIPSIGVVFLVVILETIAVPVAGVALVLGVDRLLDMMRTTTNVTGDAVVAACLHSPKSD
ncbi:MAG: dicarboxylate/amino acid:cation symporter [Acidobacteriota bacterium]|jgi:Na+/H+-dicarboxylate symporter